MFRLANSGYSRHLKMQHDTSSYAEQGYCQWHRGLIYITHDLPPRDRFSLEMPCEQRFMRGKLQAAPIQLLVREMGQYELVPFH